MTFPNRLTEEEEMLVAKYSLLRKKRKVLQQIKKSAKPTTHVPVQQPVKRTADTNQEEAKLMAKRIIAAQALKNDNKGSGFKRSRNLERRLQNPDKIPAFQPFSPVPASGGQPSSSLEENVSTSPDEKKSAYKNLYDNFVPGGLRSQQNEHDRGKQDNRGGTYEKKRGNTLYVHGYGLNEEFCKKAFKPFGTLVNITIESKNNCAFVTFKTIEAAEKAITEMDGNMLDNITVKVSMARKQPLLEATTNMNSPWTGLATGLTRERHRDARSVTVYSDDPFQ